MDLPEEFTQKTISAMLAEHPQLGEILRRYKIDCVTCGSTSCLFKNVIATHAYNPKQAAEIETEINEYLASLSI